jgi:hypothetical protein
VREGNGIQYENDKRKRMGIEEELKMQHGKGKDSKALKPEKQRSQTKFHNTGI